MLLTRQGFVSAFLLGLCSSLFGLTLTEPEQGHQTYMQHPALFWQEVPGAFKYDVQIATDASFENIVDSDTIEWHRYVPARRLSDNTWYHWRVRALDMADNIVEDWSDSRTLRVKPRSELPVIEIYESDDATAVQNKFNSANTRPSLIRFPSNGNMRIAGNGYWTTDTANLNEVIIEGRGTTITITNSKPGLYFQNAYQLQIEDLNIDYDPLQWIACKVDWKEGNDAVTTKLEGLEPWETSVNGEYRPFFAVNILKDEGEYPFRDNSWDYWGRSIYRQNDKIRFENMEHAQPGDILISYRRKNGSPAIQVNWSEHVVFTNVNIFGAIGGGIGGHHNSKLVLIDSGVRRMAGRIGSTAADGLHFWNHEIGPWVENCEFNAQGDDAINFNGHHYAVFQKIDDRSIKIENSGNTQGITPGMAVVIMPYINNFGDDLYERTVVSNEPWNDGRRLTLDAPIGDINTSEAKLWSAHTQCHNYVVRKSLFRNNRARGVSLQASGLFAENTIYNTPMAGIFVVNHMHFDTRTEGMLSNHSKIINNHVENCGYGGEAIRDETGSIHIGILDAQGRTQSYKGQHNLIVTGNTIIDWNRSALFLSSTKDSLFIDNTIGNLARHDFISHPNYAIKVQHASDSRLYNTVQDTRSFTEIDIEDNSWNIDQSPVSTGNTLRLEAEDYDEMEGIDTQPSSEGGLNVGWVNDGDWIRFSAVDFDQRYTELEARVASGGGSGSIVCMLNDPATGTVLGSIPVSDTGGWQNWVTETTDLQNVSGIHDVYFVFSGSSGFLFNVNYLTFKGPANSPATLTPYLKINDEDWQQTQVATLNEGDIVMFGPQPLSGTWSWTGPNDFTAATREIILSNLTTQDSGVYTATHESTESIDFTLTVEANLILIDDDFESGLGGWTVTDTVTTSDRSQSPDVGDGSDRLGALLWDDENTDTKLDRDLSFASTDQVYVQFDYRYVGLVENAGFQLRDGNQAGIRLRMTSQSGFVEYNDGETWVSTSAQTEPDAWYRFTLIVQPEATREDQFDLRIQSLSVGTPLDVTYTNLGFETDLDDFGSIRFHFDTEASDIGGEFHIDNVRVTNVSDDLNLAVYSDLSIQDGLLLHLDASRISGYNEDDVVVNWPNLAVPGTAATSSSAETSPSYQMNVMKGNAVLRFDGADDSLSLPTLRSTNGPIDVFMVAKSTDTDDGLWQRMLSAYNGGPDDWSAPNWIIMRPEDSGTPRSFEGSIHRKSGTMHHLEGIKIGKNGQFETQFFAGDIAEVIAYGRQLSDLERRDLQYHLSHKYGLDPSDTIDPSMDSDGDGRRDVEELIEGTDPDDPIDVFDPQLIIVAGEAQLRWNSVNGRLYKIMQSYDLSVWNEVATEFGDGLEKIHTILLGHQSHVFYRIETQHP